MPVSPPPPHPSCARAVLSGAVAGLAVQFTGANASDLEALCLHVAPRDPLVVPLYGGVEFALDRPFVRVFDTRGQAWRLVPVGAWLVMVGTGALVLDGDWFDVLFTDAAEAEATALQSLLHVSSEVTRAAGALRAAVAELDLDTIRRTPQDPEDVLWGPAPEPWSAGALRAVPDPQIRHAGRRVHQGDVWADCVGERWRVLLAGNVDNDALCESSERQSASWLALEGARAPLTLVERDGAPVPVEAVGSWAA